MLFLRNERNFAVLGSGKGQNARDIVFRPLAVKRPDVGAGGDVAAGQDLVVTVL